MTSDDTSTEPPRWQPGDERPEGAYTVADEDMGAWRNQFIADLQNGPSQLIPVAELNQMISLIVNGQTFDQSPFAGRPDYYREAWESTRQDAEAIWGRGHEVVPINDPG